MRLELALIGGILFFCCWCAYIVAKMNASVSGASAAPSAASLAPTSGGEPGAQPPLASAVGQVPQESRPHQHQHHLHQHQRNQLHPAQLDMINRPGPPVAPMQQQQQQQQQLQWAPQTMHLSGQPQLHQPVEGRWRPQWNAAASGPEAPELQAQIYGDWRDAHPGHYYPGGPSDHLSGASGHSSNADDPDEEPRVAGGPIRATGAHSSTSDGADEHDEEADQQPTGEEADDQEEGDSGEVAPLPMAQRRLSELDEGAQRRSFSENRQDSRERDQDGNLVSTWRRHLINGRPVGSSGGENNDKHRRAAQAAKRRLANEARDFEQLVDEIDATSDDNDEPKAAASAGSPMAIERRHSSVRPSMDNGSTVPRLVSGRPAADLTGQVARLNQTRPKKKDLHEHRLHESLSASQWDDSDQQQSADTNNDEQLADDEARRLEKLSQELIEEARSKSTSDDDQAEASAADEPPEEEQEEPEQRDQEPEEGSGNAAELARDGNPGADPAMESGPRVRLKRWVVSGNLSPEERTAMDAVSSETDQANISSSPERPLDVQEDISIEVLANPPLLHNNIISNNISNSGNSKGGTPSSWPDFQHHSGHYQLPAENIHLHRVRQNPYPASAAKTTANASQQEQHQHQQMEFTPTMDDFPRIESPFQASGSHKSSSKSEKSKDKDKKRWHQSRNKYKSARAYEAKRKSGRKKGKIYKLKKGNSLRHSGSKKHFRGSSKGHKSQRGRGQLGANKGVKLFKDKGYKKRGFKKEYHKLETGDHKTYFDEFRDKDHKNKWKKFDDRHKYSKSKKWSGGDVKHLNRHKLQRARAKSSNGGQWGEKDSSKRFKTAKGYVKSGNLIKSSKRRRSGYPSVD